MGMSADEFVGQSFTDLVEVESASLIAKLAMEHDLEQKISQFFHHFMFIIGFDGVDQFVDLFHRVETKALVILLLVPGTSVRRPESGHDFQYFLNGGLFFCHVVGFF